MGMNASKQNRDLLQVFRPDPGRHHHDLSPAVDDQRHLQGQQRDLCRHRPVDQAPHAGWLIASAMNNFGGSFKHPAGHAQHLQLRLPKVICTVVSACVAAYGFGRFDFPGRKAAVQHHAGHPVPAAGRSERAAVPAVQQVRLAGQPLLSWLSGSTALLRPRPTSFYQLVQFMRNVPRDLDEAAAIDGCSSFQTLYKVIVPMLGPASGVPCCALFQVHVELQRLHGPCCF